MRLCELGLSPTTLACLRTANITEVDNLIAFTCDQLIHYPGIGAAELYETVCQLNKHGYSLPSIPKGSIRVSSSRNREMLRLRMVEGLTLRETGERTGVTPERVRQILSAYFGLRSTPPAAKGRKRGRRQR